jgi:UDP-N-acetyl-D-glucosamine dehydrogenase
LQFARSGVSVLGFDLDQEKVDSINAGKTYLKHFPSESIAKQVDASRLEATTDPSRLTEVEADSYLRTHSSGRSSRTRSFFCFGYRKNDCSSSQQKECWLPLESTTYPGTTEDELRIVLEEGSGMKQVLISTWLTPLRGKTQAVMMHRPKPFPK